MFLDFIQIKSPSIRDNCNAFYDFVSNTNNTNIIEDALIQIFCGAKSELRVWRDFNRDDKELF